MRLRLWALALLASLALSACGTSAITIRGTPRMPGVDGRVYIQDAEGENRMIRVELQHLAPPQRLESGHQYYGVWFRTGGHGTTFAGRLAYDEGSRTGRLAATTPLRDVEVLITIERQPSPRAPSPHVIVRGRLN